MWSNFTAICLLRVAVFQLKFITFLWGRNLMLAGFTTTYVQSAPIITYIVNLNPAHGEVYSIQHYVIKDCQWLVASQWFSPVSFTNKTDRHKITEIFWKWH